MLFVPTEDVMLGDYTVIYGPFAAIKTGRVINGGFFLAALCRAVNSNPLYAGVIAWGLPEVKVEWFLQLADNTWVL